MELIRLTRTKGDELHYRGKKANLRPLCPLRMRDIPPCSKEELAELVKTEAHELALRLESPPDEVLYDAACSEVCINPDSFEARGGNIGKKGYVLGIQFYGLR